MNKLLTIAIPSYNRSVQLDRQIAWAVRSIGERWDACELMVSYNTSGDMTPDVCSKWQELLGDRFRSVEQDEIRGMLPNFEYCYCHAHGKYVWLVSDDDLINESAVAIVLHDLQDKLDVGVVHLNHRWVHAATGIPWGDRLYPMHEDLTIQDGRIAIEKCLRWCGPSGLYLVTAVILRRDLIPAAINAWPAAVDNLAYVFYLAAYSAAHSTVQIISQPLLDCLTGENGWRRYYRKLLHHDEPQALLKLLDLGYSADVVRDCILMRVKTRDVRQMLRYMILYPLEFPKYALKSISFYWRALRLLR